MRINWPIRAPLLWSVALGASFGLMFRVSADHNWFAGKEVMGVTLTAVMSLSYLVLGSVVVGYITVWCAEINEKRPIWQWTVLPWCSVILILVGAALFLLEGVICLVFALPILLLFTSAGGVLAGVIRRMARPGISTHLCIIALPLILPQIETHLSPPPQIRTVRNAIKISTSPSTVWTNIASVSSIRPEELPDTWTERMGFPRPIAATLSNKGVGGVRIATFERGLRFTETVTVWEPNHRLSFTIKADTEHIPPTTLDRHVTIGGPYFDVLSGEYQIEEVGPGQIVLHLTSRERLSTDFNAYASFWTDSVMSSIQRSILQVIKARCEIETPEGRPPVSALSHSKPSH
jgi:hypothetical protein